MAVVQQNEIINTFRTQVEGVENAARQLYALAQVPKQMAKSWGINETAIKKAMQQENIGKNIAIAEELMNKTGLEANDLSQGLRQMGLFIKDGKIFNNFNQELEMANINMNKLRRSAWRFNMNMLTIMFGFMALQRIVGQFGRSAITTYQKANEETQGLGKATWHLQAAWEFFKYSLVDALTQSPLFQMLVQWLLKIVQWFNKLTPATKSFIAIGLAVLFVVSAFMAMFAAIWPLISFMASWFPSLSTIVAALGISFWWVAAIIAVVVALWITDFGNFRDFVKNTLGIIWGWFVAVFGHLWQIVKDVLGIIIAIFKGDWEEVWKLTKNLGKNLIAIMLKTFIAIGMLAANILIFAWNLIIDMAFKILLGGIFFIVYKITEAWIKLRIAIVNQFSAAIDKVVSILNKLITFWNNTVGKLTGMRISPFKFAAEQLGDLNEELAINKAMYDSVNASIQTMSNSLKGSYVTADQLNNEFASVNSALDLETSNNAPTVSTGAGSGNVVNDNSTKSYTFNVQVPEGVTNTEEITKNIMEQINDQLNRQNDSALT